MEFDMDYDLLFKNHVSGITGRGVNKTGLCPFHDDTNASLSFNTDKGIWHCFAGCGSGDAYQFAEAIGIDPRPYSKNGDTGYKMRYPISRPEHIKTSLIRSTLPAVLEGKDEDKVLESHYYLMDNYSILNPPSPWIKKIVNELLIGHCPEKKCFTYPILNEDFIPINIKFHKSKLGKAPHSIKGHGQCVLYPLPLIKDFDFNKLILFAEGEKDAVTLLSNGYQAVSSSTGALSLPKNLTQIEPAKHIKFVYDQGEAGRNGSIKSAIELKRRFPEMRIGVCHWPKRYPEGYDVTDHLTASDENDLEELLQNVEYIESAPTQKPVKSIGVIPEPLDFYGYVNDNSPKPVDMIEGILPNESVMGIVSDANVGKTILALNLSMHLSAGKDWLGHRIDRAYKVLYFLAEGGYHNLRFRMKKLATQFEVRPNEGYFKTWPTVPYNLNDSSNFAEIESEIDKFSPDIFVIDTFIKCHNEDENDNRVMQDIMNIIRLFVTGKKRSGIICHHVSKQGQTRGASSVSGDFDTVIRLDWKDKASPNRLLTYEKIRNSEMLPSVKVSLNPDTLFFERVDDSFSDRFNVLMSYFENDAGIKRPEIIKKLKEDLQLGTQTCNTLFNKYKRYLVEKDGLWYKKPKE